MPKKNCVIAVENIYNIHWSSKVEQMIKQTDLSLNISIYYFSPKISLENEKHCYVSKGDVSKGDVSK